jgi:hypothetical protein
MQPFWQARQQQFHAQLRTFADVQNKQQACTAH